MNAHGSMATFTSTESSFSDLDDSHSRAIRQKLRQNRGPLERALADVITTSFLNTLLSLKILTQSETNRIKSKTSGQSKSASLIDNILRKSGTDLKIFVDTLRHRCEHVYDILNIPASADLSSSIQQSFSYLSSDLDVLGQQVQHVSSNVKASISNMQCSIPQFYMIITGVILGGLDLALLIFDEGLTLLHELVMKDRHDLLKCIPYTGQWTSLCELRVDRDNRKYAGHTPLDLAVALNRFKCQDIIRRTNSVETKLEPIAKCVRRGDVRSFRDMRRTSSTTIYYRSEDGLTVLDYACQSGVEDLVVEVIRAEREVGMERDNVDKAMCLCVELGHFRLLKHLKEYMGPRFRANQVLIDNKHLIERTAFNGDLQTYKELKRLGADVTRSVLSLAVSQNCLDFVKSVLELDTVLIQAVEFQDRRGKVPAHFAAEKGFVEMIQFLMSLNIDPLKTDRRGYNILHSAAWYGNVELARLIVVYAEEKNAKWLLLSAKDKYLGAERIFLVRGHDNTRSAWHYVEADRAVIDIFRKKTRGGAVDVAMYGEVVTSGWGTNPPLEVVKSVEERYDMTRMNPTSPSDLQPLHVAILKNHTDFSLYLISVMDEVQVTDCFGLTPLHLAAMRGNREIIEALLAKGASRSVRDEKNRTPEDVARINEHTDIIELLKPETPTDPALARLRGNLEELLSSLSDDKVGERRRLRGQEQATIYIRDTLREAQAEINDYLYEIGAGPVASEIG